MFGFQKFTATSSAFVINLVLSFMVICNLIAFEKEIDEYPTFGIIFICFNFLLAIVVNMIMTKIVVVYLDGELESVTKEKFLEAIKSQDISYIPNIDYDLDGLACMNFFLSTFEWELVDGEIERIMWKKYGSNL